MRVLLFVLLLAVTPRDDKEDLKKAREKTAALSSYMVQWHEEWTLLERPRTQGGSSEYVAPDLITFKTGLTEIVKKGDAAMSKTKKGWVKAEEDTRAKSTAAGLKPAHEFLPALFDKIDAPKKGKASDHNKIKCTAYSGTLSGDALRDVLKAWIARLTLPERAIDWANSKTDVEILVNTKEPWVEKITIQGDLKTIAQGVAGVSTVPFKRTIEYFNHNNDKPDIDPEVRKSLGIEEAGDKR